MSFQRGNMVELKRDPDGGAGQKGDCGEIKEITSLGVMVEITHHNPGCRPVGPFPIGPLPEDIFKHCDC